MRQKSVYTIMIFTLSSLLLGCSMLAVGDTSDKIQRGETKEYTLTRKNDTQYDVSIEVNLDGIQLFIDEVSSSGSETSKLSEYQLQGETPYYYTVTPGTGSVVFKLHNGFGSHLSSYYDAIVKFKVSSSNSTTSTTVAGSSVKTVEVPFKYRNTTGDKPELQVDTSLVPTSFTFSSHAAALNSASGVDISFNNVSIVESNKSYKVTAIKAEEKIDNVWKQDVEFVASYTNNTNIAAALVLDRSQSLVLANAFTSVKSYAKNFIDIVAQNTNNNAAIGLVAFGSTQSERVIDQNYSLMKTWIDSLESEGYTTLFDAVDIAADSLNAVANNYQGLAIVAFTDGIDNTSTKRLSDVKTKLESNTKLKCFTIGLGKDIDETALEALAVRGSYKKAESVSDLSTIFTAFSGAVSNVFSIKYTRSKGIVADWRDLKLTITISE